MIYWLPNWLRLNVLLYRDFFFQPILLLFCSLPFSKFYYHLLAYYFLYFIIVLFSFSNTAMGIRGPKPGTTIGRKRKTEDELSTNPHTQKARKRLENMNETEKEIARAQGADNSAISRTIKVLREGLLYQSASNEEKKRMEEETKEKILNER
jgi:hypothetical protein